MDPVTALLNLATGIFKFGEKVWDATPEPLKAQGASDWAKFTHNIASVVLDLQDKINHVK